MPVNPIFFVEHNLADRIDEIRRQIAALSRQMEMATAISGVMFETQKLLAISVMMGRVLDSMDSEPTWEDECEAELRDMKSDFFMPEYRESTLPSPIRWESPGYGYRLELISGLTPAQLEALFDILLDTDEYLDEALVAIGIDVEDGKGPNFCDIRRDLQIIFDLSQCIRCWVWAYTDTIVNEDWYCIGCHAKFDQQDTEDQGKHLG